MGRIEVPQNEFTAALGENIPQGAEAVVGYVYSLDPEQRIKAAQTAQKAMFAAAKDEDGLNAYVEAMRALIERGISGLGNAGTDEDSDAAKNGYNVMSFNLAADLADCWPEDTLPRSSRHFAAGLRAAEDCIRWRNELNKPPRSFALAYWVKGMHLLSLRHLGGAVKSFGLSLGFAQRAAQEAGLPSELSPEASFDVILNYGYLALAELLHGDETAAARYEEALAAYREQVRIAEEKQDAELKEDAGFGIAQLETVRAKYVPQAVESR